jgi:hypothetical protein
MDQRSSINLAMALDKLGKNKEKKSVEPSPEKTETGENLTFRGSGVDQNEGDGTAKFGGESTP